MHKATDAGFTLIELLLVVAIIGILAAIAVPALLRARISGNEASAIASLRVINSSQHAFSTSCGNGYYAPSLTVLGDPPPADAGFISPDLGSSDVVVKSGYRVTMEEGDDALPSIQDGCNPSGTAGNLFSSYWASNEPVTPYSTGNRWFWTNTLGAIYAWSSDVFDGETGGNRPPTVGAPLQ